MSREECDITLLRQPYWAVAGEGVGPRDFLFRITLPKRVQVGSIAMTILDMSNGEKTAPANYGTVLFQLPAAMVVVDGMQVIELVYSDKVSSEIGVFRIPFYFEILDRTGAESSFTCMSEPVDIQHETYPPTTAKQQERFWVQWGQRAQMLRAYADNKLPELAESYKFTDDAIALLNTSAFVGIKEAEDKYLHKYLDLLHGLEFNIHDDKIAYQNMRINGVLWWQWCTNMRGILGYTVEQREEAKREEQRKAEEAKREKQRKELEAKREKQRKKQEAQAERARRSTYSRKAYYEEPEEAPRARSSRTEDFRAREKHHDVHSARQKHHDVHSAREKHHDVHSARQKYTEHARPAREEYTEHAHRPTGKSGHARRPQEDKHYRPREEHPRGPRESTKHVRQPREEYTQHIREPEYTQHVRHVRPARQHQQALPFNPTYDPGVAYYQPPPPPPQTQRSPFDPLPFTYPPPSPPPPPYSYHHRY